MQKTQTGFADTLINALRNNWLYIALLIFLVIFPHLVGWVTGDSPFGVGGRPRGQSIFWQGIMVQAFLLAILAMSYNLMFGFTGVISFGHALFFGLGGYALGMILEMTDLSGVVGLVTGVAIGLTLAGVIGFLMGLVSLRLKGVYFAIFTLAVSEMAFIYVGSWRLTNAEDGFAVSSSNLVDILNATSNRLAFYYIALILALLTFLFIRRLMHSPTGRVLLAIRENEDRAQAIGFNTLRYKLLSITVASMMAALAGMMWVMFQKKIGPEILSVQFTIEPLLMTIIGGIGTFGGPVVGAALLFLSEQLLDREFIIGGIELNVGEYWSLILGIAFIVVVLIFPQGIVGTLNKWLIRLRHGGKVAKPVEREQAAATGD